MRALLLLALLLTLVLGQRLVAPEEVARAQVIQKALPAVVRVQGSALSPGGEDVVGTGFFVGPSRVVTNYHVIRDLKDLTVRLADGRTFLAERYAVDPGIDLALLTVRGARAPGVLAFAQVEARRLPWGWGWSWWASPTARGPWPPSASSRGWAPWRFPCRTRAWEPKWGSTSSPTPPSPWGTREAPCSTSRARWWASWPTSSGGRPGSGASAWPCPGTWWPKASPTWSASASPKGDGSGPASSAWTNSPRPPPGRGPHLHPGGDGGPGGAGKPRGQGRPQRGPAGHPGRLLALGDVILAVDGVAVKDKADVVRLVAQRRPGDRVRLTLWRDRRRLEVTVVLMARPRE